MGFLGRSDNNPGADMYNTMVNRGHEISQLKDRIKELELIIRKLSNKLAEIRDGLEEVEAEG